jgi:hypothetical protein
VTSDEVGDIALAHPSCVHLLRDAVNACTVETTFQSLLEAWAAAIVANNAEQIASFAEPDW